MLPIQKNIQDLKTCLYRILDMPTEGTCVKAELKQEMSLDEKTAEALAKNCKGDLYIVQTGQINVQVISESGKALQYVDKIESNLNRDLSDLDAIVSDLFSRGWKADAIESFVRNKIYDMAEACTRSKAAAARKLGIERTTFIERRNKQRRQEDKMKLLESK